MSSSNRICKFLNRFILATAKGVADCPDGRLTEIGSDYRHMMASLAFFQDRKVKQRYLFRYLTAVSSDHRFPLDVRLEYMAWLLDHNRAVWQDA